MKSMSIFSFLMLAANFALAASGNEGGHDGHAHGPNMTVVMYQAINVGAILIGLVYFLRQPVKDFFAAQKTAYLDAASKTQAARTAAENELKGIRAELTRIETTAAESVARARAESADLRKQLVTDAEVAAARIRTEAETSARMEADRAIAKLRAELVNDAVAAARQQISGGVSQEDHQRLNKEFIRNIEAAQT